MLHTRQSCQAKVFKSIQAELAAEELRLAHANLFLFVGNSGISNNYCYSIIVHVAEILLLLSCGVKVMLHRSTCNIDFPWNTVLCFRDMLHKSTYCATLLNFLMVTFMLHGMTCNATSICSIIF